MIRPAIACSKPTCPTMCAVGLEHCATQCCMQTGSSRRGRNAFFQVSPSWHSRVYPHFSRVHPHSSRVHPHVFHLQQLIGDSQLDVTCAALETFCGRWEQSGGYMMGAMLVVMLNYPFFIWCAVVLLFFQCTCILLSCKVQASSLRHLQS